MVRHTTIQVGGQFENNHYTWARKQAGINLGKGLIILLICFGMKSFGGKCSTVDMNNQIFDGNLSQIVEIMAELHLLNVLYQISENHACLI